MPLRAFGLQNCNEIIVYSFCLRKNFLTEPKMNQRGLKLFNCRLTVQLLSVSIDITHSIKLIRTIIEPSRIQCYSRFTGKSLVDSWSDAGWYSQSCQQCELSLSCFIWQQKPGYSWERHWDRIRVAWCHSFTERAFPEHLLWFNRINHRSPAKRYRLLSWN